MNQEQFLVIVRGILQISGTFAVTSGLFTDGTWATAGGAIVTLAGLGWAVVANRQAAQVAKVAAMTEVASVQTKPTAAGIDLAFRADGGADASVVVKR